MKAAMANHAGVFNTNRMVREYFGRCYLPSMERSERLAAEEYEGAKGLAAWKAEFLRQWPEVRLERVWSDGPDMQALKVGDQLQVQAQIDLGGLSPTDVAVELYHGRLDANGLIVEGQAIPMLIAQSKGKGKYVFAGAIPCETSGRHGYALRILPQHEDLGSPFEMGLVLWGA
jgi:starch phosphorylase